MMNKQSSNILCMMIGLPAHGKDSFIKKNSEIFEGFVIVSSDDYIETKAKEEGKTYDQVFSKYASEANRYAREEAFKSIIEGKNVVWNQTNLTEETRKHKLDLFPSSYCKIAIEFGILFDEVLKNRLNSREGKTIPEDVIQRMKKSFQRADKKEGFDEIIFVDPYTGDYWKSLLKKLINE